MCIRDRDWIAVANRLVPVLGAGTTSMPRFMTLPKYRLLGLEVFEMAEYKYPNSSCTEQYSFVVCFKHFSELLSGCECSLAPKCVSTALQFG